MVRNALPDSAKFRIEYPGDDSIFDQSDKEYLVQAIPRFQRLDGTNFSTVQIGDDFERILENVEGRYFGFIYFQGFDQVVSYVGWPGIEIGVGALTLCFDGEVLNLFSDSGGPYLLINFLVVDKATKNFLYFNNKVFFQAPFNEKMIKRYFRKICEEI